MFPDESPLAILWTVSAAKAKVLWKSYSLKMCTERNSTLHEKLLQSYSLERHQHDVWSLFCNCILQTTLLCCQPCEDTIQTFCIIIHYSHCYLNVPHQCNPLDLTKDCVVVVDTRGNGSCSVSFQLFLSVIFTVDQKYLSALPSAFWIKQHTCTQDSLSDRRWHGPTLRCF